MKLLLFSFVPIRSALPFSCIVMLSCVELKVNLDPRFVNHTELHVLNLTDSDRTPVSVINAQQTQGADWLLLSAVNDSACQSFPSPYDNDYRGADDNNPDDIPSRYTIAAQ